MNQMKTFLVMPQPTHKLLKYVSIATLSAVVSLLSPVPSPLSRAALHDSPKVVLDEAWQLVNQEYVDSTFNQNDWQAVRHDLLNRDYADREEAYAALQEALERLEDPYTRFMDPEQYEELTSQTSGEFSGVGLRLKVEEETQNLVIVEPLDGSPALEAGLRAGDRILAIEGESTEDMSVQDAARLIRGELGTRITLSISRNNGEAFDVPLLRARLEVPTVFSGLRNEFDTKIGYIRLTEFSAHAAEQMQEAIANLVDQGAEAFVLDLRGNPGGLLQASIEISRMWLGEGDIVHTINRSGESEGVAADHTALTDLPLAVLVDGNSASSSEILTGALKDNGRAVVIGSQTFGKALVQAVHALSDGSGLAVTVAHYYTPNGTDISHRGITPDIQLDLSLEQRRRLAAQPEMLGTLADPHFQEAISALRPLILAHRSNPQLSHSSLLGR